MITILQVGWKENTEYGPYEDKYMYLQNYSNQACYKPRHDRNIKHALDEQRIDSKYTL